MKRLRPWLAVGGAVVAAAAASACCVLPVVLIGAGITGAWMASLQVLEPFRPYLLAIAWGLWALAFYRERQKAGTCGVDGTCEKPSYRMFWISGALLLLISASPWLVNQLV